MVKTSRRLIVELLRLAFCFWILYYHEFLITKSGYFVHGHFAVEFFFLLTGLYTLKTLSIGAELPVFKGLWKFIKPRITKLLPFVIISFSIGFIIIIIAAICGKFDIMMLAGYTYEWYLAFMLIALAILYLIKRACKSNKVFYLVLAIISACSYAILFYTHIKIDRFTLEWHYIFRALGGISAGMLLSLIPPLKIKNWIIGIITIVVIAITFRVGMFASDTKHFMVLIFFLYPSCLYFANQVNLYTSKYNIIGKATTIMYINMSFLAVIFCLVDWPYYYYFIINVCFTAVLIVLDILIKKNKVKKQIKSLN